MLRRLTAVLILAPGIAMAACSGPSLVDSLSPDDRAALDARSAATPFGTGLMWQATRDDATVTVIGTMHLADPRHAPLMDRIDDRIATATGLMVEMTPDEEAQMMAAMGSLPETFFIQSGPTLPDRLDPAIWDALADAARDRQYPPMMAAKSQPWFLTLALAIPPCAIADIAAGSRGLDQMIIDAATAAAVPLQSLEPWETFPTLFATLDEGMQDDILRLSIVDAATQQAMFVATLDSYFAERVAEIMGLGQIIGDDASGLEPADAEAALAAIERILIDDRNAAWIPVIDAAATPGSATIVAVGAAHLPGEAGVLRLLERDGWTVAPLD